MVNYSTYKNLRLLFGKLIHNMVRESVVIFCESLELVDDLGVIINVPHVCVLKLFEQLLESLRDHFLRHSVMGLWLGNL